MEEKEEEVGGGGTSRGRGEEKGRQEKEKREEKHRKEKIIPRTCSDQYSKSRRIKLFSKVHKF